MIWAWAAFVGFVLLLFLDLGVFHRRAHVVTMKEALRLPPSGAGSNTVTLGEPAIFRRACLRHALRFYLILPSCPPRGAFIGATRSPADEDPAGRRSLTRFVDVIIFLNRYYMQIGACP